MSAEKSVADIAADICFSDWQVKIEKALARERARAEKAEMERDESSSTVRSLATMLGWVNVPPREVLERSLNAERANAKATTAELVAERAKSADLRTKLMAASHRHVATLESIQETLRSK